MKTIFPLSVLALAIAALPVAAQTTNPVASSAAKKTATGTPAAAASQSARGCVKLPTLSPKIPALPAGLSCAKPLYTITRIPGAKLTDISPMEDPALRDALGIPLPDSFTLSYIDTKVGSGALLVPRKWYSIQYTGYLVDGTKFDSSFDHPGHAPLSFQQGPQGPQGQRQVVPGMDTGLDGMKVGGKRRLFIPYQLAYGPSAHGNIPPKSMLIFDVELVSQSDKDPTPKPPVPPATTCSSSRSRASASRRRTQTANSTRASRRTCTSCRAQTLTSTSVSKVGRERSNLPAFF
jgi:peptidylprolyl isomerase